MFWFEHLRERADLFGGSVYVDSWAGLQVYTLL